MRKPVYLRLTQEEFETLRNVALNECRDPREHARYLLRVGLGLQQRTDPEKHNDAVRPLAREHGAVAAIAG